MNWWSHLSSPATPVLVVLLLVILLLLRPFRNRLQRQREATAAASSLLGMRYRPPGGPAGKGPVDEGSHFFSGKGANGIDWSVETLLLCDPPMTDAAAPETHAARSYSRWTSRVEADSFGGEGYLLLLNLPVGAHRPLVRPGVLDELLDKMAALTLFLYVRSYFGEARGGGLTLRPQHRQWFNDEPLDARYTLFCHPPERLSRLNAPTRAWLLERQALHLAVLWDGAGLAVSCPGGRLAPQAVAEFSEMALQLSGFRQANEA